MTTAPPTPEMLLASRSYQVHVPRRLTNVPWFDGDGPRDDAQRHPHEARPGQSVAPYSRGPSVGLQAVVRAGP